MERSWVMAILAEAIIESCDVFFYTTGVKKASTLAKKAHYLLGDITGIEKAALCLAESGKTNANRTGLMVTLSI